MIRTLNYFIQDRMPNGRPPPHPCVYPDLGSVGCLRKCKSSILSGLPQANTLRNASVFDIPTRRCCAALSSWITLQPAVNQNYWIRNGGAEDGPVSRMSGGP